jgi:hypothetical protein
LLDPLPDERRRGPLELFEKIALAGFALAALSQAILGAVRAHGSWIGSLVTAIAILLCGGLWLLRARRMSAGVLAVPAGLFLATMGVYSGYTATNVPFVSVLGRFAVPALLVLLGAVLLFAEQDWQFQRVPLALAAIVFVVVQVVLTGEARSDGRPIPMQNSVSGGVLGEVQLIPLARSFVEAINAHDAAAIRALTTIPAEQLPDYPITVTRWIAEDNTVIAFGTASGKPAAMRAEFRDRKIVEWQVYTEQVDNRGGHK